MSGELSFFDMSVSTSPPNGHLQPMPITLGPNWQPNDIRLLFIVGGGNSGSVSIDMAMDPDPPSGFTSAYSINPDRETYGVYYRRLQSVDEDTDVVWAKPASWEYFWTATLTVRGVSPVNNPTAGRLGVTYITSDATDSATVASATVPGAGAMVLFVGSIAAPEKSSWPHWGVAMGVPDNWTHLVATDKSGSDFDEFDTAPAIIVVGKSYSSSGTTGIIEIPAAQGSPAFASMYVHLPAAPAVAFTVGGA